MIRGRWIRIALAFLLALLVNGAGLYLMIRVNKYVHASVRNAEATTSAIHLQEPPEKQRRHHIRQQVARARPRAVPMPVPNLPSSISSANLMPNIGRVDLLSDLLGQQQGWNVGFILKEEAVDDPPRITRRVVPEYPASAEDRGIEGYVVFKLQISASGKVEKVWVVKSKPPGVFEAAAERAVRHYQFSPARFRGRPVAVLCRQKIVFKLED